MPNLALKAQGVAYTKPGNTHSMETRFEVLLCCLVVLRPLFYHHTSNLSDLQHHLRIQMKQSKFDNQEDLYKSVFLHHPCKTGRLQMTVATMSTALKRIHENVKDV